jgi:formate dehydrogenase subunit gamma
MLQAHARHLGALIVGFALALPFAAAAQQKAPEAAPAKAAAATKADAPKADAGPAYTPPTPAKGSTAVPGWNNPPESWDALSEKPQYASIPGVEKNRLIQSEGREWRAFRNGPITRYAGWLIAGVFAAIVLFYFIRGTIPTHGAPTGRLIERFNGVERVTHWTMTIAFVFLALTGVVILWGKHIVLPWLGYTGNSWLTIFSKNLHNFVGPLFIFSLAVLFLLFVKDNFYQKGDLYWLSKVGGMLGGDEPPSGRFNAGEKIWFWLATIVFGLAVSVTGLILDFPNWNQAREVMQQANVIHAIFAVLFICGAMGHGYLGTLGVDGAWRAMRDGYVDETWAKSHHSLWYDEVKAGKRPERVIPAGTQPAAGDD